jgi:uncharacterized repeat protein (TIGR01451 family)
LFRTAADPNVLYAIYVLALAGKSPQAEMNYYAENNVFLTIESKYLLAAAFALSGNKLRFKALLPSNFSGENADRSTWGYYNSILKSEALALNAMVETDINNPQIGILAKHLSEQLKGTNYYWNTQERAFALLALGKIAKKLMSTAATAQIFVDGKLFQNFSGNEVVLQLNNSHQNVKIVTTSGNLFYYYETEGIAANGSFIQEDKFIKARRTILTKTGSLIGMNRFNQNDLIVIKLTVSNSTGNKVENIAVTDLLPAGFEIENPRIKSIPGMSWITDNSYYTNMDIRDDRITYFTNLEGTETKSFYYMVRAVAKGTYNQGPVSADAMYAGEYHSYFGAGKVVIR